MILNLRIYSSQLFFSLKSYEMNVEFEGVKILFLQKDYKVCEKI